MSLILSEDFTHWRLKIIGKKLKPNEKILMRVYSQGRSGYVALEALKAK
jgi:hypothetical protein